MILYLHGGPGFNSHAEISILQPSLATVYSSIDFWHEPSSLRSGEPFIEAKAFSQQIKSIDKRLNNNDTVIAHSFAVHLILHLQKTRPRMGLKLIVIAPVIDLIAAHRRILLLAARDFLTTQPALAAELVECSKQMKSVFDAPSERGLTLAAQDTSLFNHYWHSAKARDQFNQLTSSPEKQFDALSFVQTLREFATLPAHQPVNGIKRLGLIFGQTDPVVDIAAETALARKYFMREPEVEVFANARHWPHLEQPDAFVRLLKKFI